MKEKIVCENCAKEFERNPVNTKKCRKKYGKDICHSCMQKEQYKQGLRDFQKIRTAEVSRALQTGKTFEERYGEAKARACKEKLSKSYLEKFGKEKAEEVKKKLSEKSSGSNNANFNGKYCHGFGDKQQPSVKGKTFEEIYGEEKALNYRKKLSLASSGKNNSMYGKPSPQGSGNGWSGWYKGWYFRSLLELSYMINIIEKQNLLWDTGERAKYSVPYIDWDGTDRTYFSDFIIEENRMIELKPSNLRNSKTVLLKEQAASLWCSEHNFVYQIVESSEVCNLSKKEIKQLHDSDQLKFINRYEEKYKKWILDAKSLEEN